MHFFCMQRNLWVNLTNPKILSDTNLESCVWIRPISFPIQRTKLQFIWHETLWQDRCSVWAVIYFSIKHFIFVLKFSGLKILFVPFASYTFMTQCMVRRGSHTFKGILLAIRNKVTYDFFFNFHLKQHVCIFLDEIFSGRFFFVLTFKFNLHYILHSR